MPSSSPIFALPLFPKVDQLLIDLLRTLSIEDWEKRTIVPHWTIKDIAAHLLDGNIRALSMLRDQYFGEKAENIQSYPDLVAYLNRLNADWVQAFKRVSPAVLIELLAITGPPYQAFLASLDPFAPATFSVAWAGEQESLNWFHIAREYTEKWHHQQQIRLALGQEEVLYADELYYPHLDTSMRALPYHYRAVTAEEGAVIAFSVSGVRGAHWFLQREASAWTLHKTHQLPVVCSVNIEAAVAWRIFTKGISKAEALEHVQIQGERKLGEVVLDMLAVMA
ncbi:maleylpyruvate isomerase N-terminal domain-containing protein [Haliscomenobacter hydrossis]|uniref:Mycothiol-dependent maleylpyruvate isomerase metal-binding domain-containing protein n=1 Tax=Haliscomenobacter hydrossis (strain ATCC 27775 / DSM 1100 / LMG 10767 / O) TaxID=760192 RepID=F4L5K1_HALH1|nr:maleylpyruvate isomerase N-terminal domain-containing protein [Haliscomenobacter hydrossis]AEE51836.1 hypothetical protein Halhy_3988 [Haliscomenobacter hydrossis DSM 1100]